MKQFLLSCLVLILINCQSTQASSFGGEIRDNGEYSLWWALSGERVMRDDKPKRKALREIQIYLAKNEVESFQLIITPKADVKVNLMSLPKTKDIEVSCNTVWFVSSEKLSVPDILSDCRLQEFKKGENGLFWITIKTFAKTRDGDHEFTLKINDDIVKVKTRVFNFLLPEKPSLKTIARVWWEKKMEEKVELRAIYENLKEHRVLNGGYAMPGPKVTLDENTKRIVVDFMDFDRAAEYLINKLNYDSFLVPFFFGNWDGLISEKWLNKIPVASKDFEKYYGDYLEQLHHHLKKNGWLEKAYIQPWDEPQKKDLDKVIRIARIIREKSPGLKVYLATPPKKELYGLVDVWTVPLLRKYFNGDEIKKRQSLNEEVWGYQNYHFNYLSQPLNMRLLPWLAKKYRLSGIEWWAVNHWRPEYYETHPYLSDKPGNGILIYPSSDGSRQPLNSIRWELYRDGLEDIEYITLLEKKAGRETADKIINQVIKGIDPDERVVDPYLLEKLRIQMGKEIEKLHRRNAKN